MEDIRNKIIQHLPFGPSFTFVDEILDVSTEGVTGAYTFKGTEHFYKDHFPEMPVTPGVMMIETMGQIGVVCYFVFLMITEKGMTDFSHIKPVFTSCDVEFLKPVYPGDRVLVRSKKIYFRLNKFKCHAEMLNNKQEIVCKGHLSGIYLES